MFTIKREREFANMSKVLVTGATGFVGRSVVSSLLVNGHQVKALVRKVSVDLPAAVEQVTGDLQDLQCIQFLPSPQSTVIKVEEDLNRTLVGVDVLVHCAARVHVMNDDAIDALAEFRKVNTLATLSLARQAAEAGVKRFIFVS